MTGYLKSKEKSQCSACEACVQICPTKAIVMREDEEKFRYPVVDHEKCIQCGMCEKVCPYENNALAYEDEKKAYGGCIQDLSIREESTSGGAFTAIVNSWCDDNYVIFGARTEGLEVFHDYITDIQNLGIFRKSKYLQSKIGNSYVYAKEFLKEGKKVLFSGTPCQIAGLRKFLGSVDQSKLLTVEVICEGVPTPHFIERYDEWLNKKYGNNIAELDYRYKDMTIRKTKSYGKWDFQVMKTTLKDGRVIKKDRWVNPFWSIWLNHLMSRPSCYSCLYANTERVADISLGDLWGVHLYCPELYKKNSGASLVVCNSKKGIEVLEKAKEKMEGHELEFSTALKYQSPMRKSINENPDRDAFMKDVQVLEYFELCKKWSNPPSLKLLWSKYIWGNRQKVWLWNLKNRLKGDE